MRNFLLRSLALMLAAPGALAAEPPDEAKDKDKALQASADGSVVIDKRAGLSWSRCVEGMQWTGQRCSGEPLRMPQAQAIARAAARSKTDGTQWRLPRVTELRRLAGQGAAKPPGLDPQLFPDAPLDWHWSGTANTRQDRANPYNYGNVMREHSAGSGSAATLLTVWAVHLGSGEGRGDWAKSHHLMVRLVRAE
jgi:Protein of unknown function (DUF1566)